MTVSALRTTTLAPTTFLELEITARCQLTCTHCYAESGPTGGHGHMGRLEWQKVITDAAALGVRAVQFIGGEPTVRPDFASLLRHALAVGLEVEVFSNLVAIKDAWWELFSRPGVSLATSYYSDDPERHEAVTGRRGSHARTRDNIRRAVRHRIPIRVGIIDILDGQRVAQAEADLRALGVTAISTDRMRGVGRGATRAPTVGELCGRCGRGRAAISPDGDVKPCVLSPWMIVGNVRDTPLADLLTGPVMRDHVAAIPMPAAICNPDCKPSRGDGVDCAPAETETCGPSFCNPDLKK